MMIGTLLLGLFAWAVGSPLLGLIALAIYFLPIIVAMVRHARNTGGIVLINIFLGWTLIGWLAAFIWACVSEPRSPAIR